MSPDDAARRSLHRHWSRTIQQAGVNLTPWETRFVASVAELLRRGLALSDPQAQALERIYADRTP